MHKWGCLCSLFVTCLAFILPSLHLVSVVIDTAIPTSLYIFGKIILVMFSWISVWYFAMLFFLTWWNGISFRRKPVYYIKRGKFFSIRHISQNNLQASSQWTIFLPPTHTQWSNPGVCLWCVCSDRWRIPCQIIQHVHRMPYSISWKTFISWNVSCVALCWIYLRMLPV